MMTERAGAEIADSRPAPFVPWTVPSASSSPSARRPLPVQCGSEACSTSPSEPAPRPRLPGCPLISARLTVPSGMPSQASGGEMFGTLVEISVQVCFLGMRSDLVEHGAREDDARFDLLQSRLGGIRGRSACASRLRPSRPGPKRQQAAAGAGIAVVVARTARGEKGHKQDSPNQSPHQPGAAHGLPLVVSVRLCRMPTMVARHRLVRCAPPGF